MQKDYFDLLSEPVQQFVIEVEKGAGLSINVFPDSSLNCGGAFGQGNLEVFIKARTIRLSAPTNGYFPDGAVRHEVLHVRRFHVDGVPKLVADNDSWDKGLADRLGGLDNALEHLVIVPEELRFHPERRVHWEALMSNVCTALLNIPDVDRRLAVYLHWTFIKYVLPNSPSTEIMANFAKLEKLFLLADSFADRFIKAAASKEELLRILFLEFSDLPRTRAAMEYINSRTGTLQKPIP